MRYRFVLSMLPLAYALPACTAQQQNGQDLRVAAPPVISAQPWQVKQQYISTEGERICTVSAGAMDVTQQTSNRRDIVHQVAIAYSLNPGEIYTLLVNGHRYETRNNWFAPKESSEIINDLLASATVYTEVQNQFMNDNERRQFNTIALNSFASRYQLCKKFVHR